MLRPGLISPHERQYRGRPDEARAAMDALAKAGYGRWADVTTGDKGGRPAERFELGVTKNHANPNESVGFGDGDTGDGGKSKIGGDPTPGPAGGPDLPAARIRERLDATDRLVIQDQRARGGRWPGES